MKKGFEYKGFYGSAEISIKDDCLYGKIEFIDDLVSYESDTPKGLEKAFREAVDDHIATRESLGWEVHKSASGTFNVRVGPELHRAALIRAKLAGVSLNEVVKTALNEYLDKTSPQKTLANAPQIQGGGGIELAGRFIFVTMGSFMTPSEPISEVPALPAITGGANQAVDLWPLFSTKGEKLWTR